jgi:hypothetical protein
VRKAQCNMEFVFELSIYGRAEGNVENLDRVCFKTDVCLNYIQNFSSYLPEYTVCVLYED